MPDTIVIYSPSYTMHALGLDRLHPFDLHKYRRAWADIRRRVADAESHLIAPEAPLSEDDLLAVHSEDYLQSLKKPEVVAAAVEVGPVAYVPRRLLDRALLKPMRSAAAGTVLGARRMLDGQSCINIGGGFHHASQDRAEGFCFYADIPLAVAALRRDERFGASGRVLVIDLDAHMGNGVARCLRDDRESFIFDMFNGDIYPHDPAALERIDAPTALSIGMGGEEYLYELGSRLPPFLDSLAGPEQPAVVIYNAGTDVYVGDALGGLSLSFEDIVARDRMVIEACRQRGLAWLMVTSGGYSADSSKMIAETAVWALG